MPLTHVSDQPNGLPSHVEAQRTDIKDKDKDEDEDEAEAEAAKLQGKEEASFFTFMGSGSAGRARENGSMQTRVHVRARRTLGGGGQIKAQPSTARLTARRYSTSN